MRNDIDLVVLWVDGNDPQWQKEKAEALGLEGDQRIIRYRDMGLMKYWFRAVEKNLPWVRKVHFVTYGHLPEGLNTENPKLHIVNHRDFIPAEYLPTFNSTAIEMNLFRIEDLAEQFIYANDDMFFLRPLQPEFFFRNGLPVDAAVQNVFQFHSRDMIYSHIMNDLLIINDSFRKRAVIRKNPGKWFHPRYGFGALKNLYLLPITHFTGFMDPHVPCSYLKSTFIEAYEKYRDAFETTFSHKIRNRDDVNQWLCRYWQFASGNFVPGSAKRGALLSVGEDDKRIESVLASASEPMICVNDDNMETDFETEKAFLISCFERAFPEKCSFEI